MRESLTIPAGFNGPRSSGNGGYAAGVLAAFVGEPAEVSLRSPVPLDRPLDVGRDGNGSVRLLDGETLVCEGRALDRLELETPQPVSVNEARRATTAYRGLSEGEFSHCFVCGKARADGFKVFAGPVEGRDLVASTWVPPTWVDPEGGGDVPRELIWAVLDCPTYFATHIEGELSTAVLARMSAEVLAPVEIGAEHVVVGWPLEADGRKLHAGSAIFSAAGELLARARALLIEPRDA